MNGLLARYWLRLIAGAGLAFLAIGFLAPGRAAAACGDYVSFGSDSGNHSSHGPQSLPVSRPCRECHGPYCDSNHTPAPQPPTVPVRVHDSACLVRLPAGGPTDSIPLWVGVDAQNRIHRTLFIFHPPRPI